MAFSSWFSRLRSSSQSIYTKLRNSYSYNRSTALSRSFAGEVVGSEHNGKPFVSCRGSSLLPLALAVSAGSLVFQSCHNNSPSNCQAPNLDQTGKSIGGKGSTDYMVKGSHKNVPQELIEELKVICKENMTMDYDERHFHGKPQNSFHKAVNIPDIIVFPRSEDEVSKIVALCNRHKVPIVPYGGATSIEGHTLSPNGGVCIDMTQMKV
ncbi:D-lactate dehydrogenase (cytochrome) [Handroanthus impetiginosus]|uniref:D-lactate dehydrogenase (Cytochrome) n=1 Tax=Handroanthus impetiginosus TaxID=429701 RepID=A0A2G9GTF3_9LAMI|nr:D-lactate dehydrogenase (cytochrome) [Handroanthus impetiginosus]